jgi:hypothetical protein
MVKVFEKLSRCLILFLVFGVSLIIFLFIAFKIKKPVEEEVLPNPKAKRRTSFHGNFYV